jgi:hypothetical protein
MACGNSGCYWGMSQYAHAIRATIATKYENTTSYVVDGVSSSPVALNYAVDECGSAQGAPLQSQLASILTAVMNGYQSTGNSFTSNGTVDISEPCRKLGRKQVQAMKKWHGRFDFDSYTLSGKDVSTNTTYSDTKYRIKLDGG